MHPPPGKTKKNLIELIERRQEEEFGNGEKPKKASYYFDHYFSHFQETKKMMEMMTESEVWC